MVYVFKTSVATKKQVKQLRPFLDALLEPAAWNFDLQDCDKILRIETDENKVRDITGLLQQHAFFCTELE